MNKPLNEKSYIALALLAMLYFFVCLYVLGTEYSLSENWSDNGSITYFVSVMTTIVPTIVQTAAITPLPSASEVILSIAWAIVIPAVMLMLLFADWIDIDDKKTNDNNVLEFIFAAIFLFFMMFCFVQFIIPTPGYSPRNMFMYSYLKDTDWFVIVYGLMLWGLSAVLLFATIYKVLILSKIKGNKNE